ncbi:disulfide bond formation protein B [Roseovarius salis]|uniref:disulfide bond formation protein B n=1 Tax=Roseovarius salis TaxID=3376063 RepID=UPI0037C98E2A
MTFRRIHFILLAAGGSATLMLAALAFQHLGGLPPCKLCIWQRYPHVIAIAIGAAALAVPGRALPLMGMVAALTTGGIGIYHSGVERGWWEGPGTCTAADPGGLSTDQAFEQMMSAPLVRCDEIPWELLGLSMANWNVIAALALAGLWAMAARRG